MLLHLFIEMALQSADDRKELNIDGEERRPLEFILLHFETFLSYFGLPRLQDFLVELQIISDFLPILDILSDIKR